MSTVNGFQVGSETLKYNYESLDNYNTPNFSTSSSKTYAVGDYVMYNGKLYKCTTATTGGTWVSGSWTLAVLSDDVSELNRQLSDVEENQIPELKSAFDIHDNTERGIINPISRIINADEFEVGTLPVGSSSRTDRTRTKDYYWLKQGDKIILGYDLNPTLLAQINIWYYTSEKVQSSVSSWYTLNTVTIITVSSDCFVKFHGSTGDISDFAGHVKIEYAMEGKYTLDSLALMNYNKFRKPFIYTLCSRDFIHGEIDGGSMVANPRRAVTTNMFSCKKGDYLIPQMFRNSSYVVVKYNSEKTFVANSPVIIRPYCFDHDGYFRIICIDEDARMSAISDLTIFDNYLTFVSYSGAEDVSYLNWMNNTRIIKTEVNDLKLGRYIISDGVYKIYTTTPEERMRLAKMFPVSKGDIVKINYPFIKMRILMTATDGTYIGFTPWKSLEDGWVDSSSYNTVGDLIIDYDGFAMIDFYIYNASAQIQTITEETLLNYPNIIEIIHPITSNSDRIVYNPKMPHCRRSKKINNVQIGQDGCVINNKLWVFQESGANAGGINIISLDTFESVGSKSHTLGHINSISYNENTDCLVTYGSNGQNMPTIVIYKNPEASETLSLSDENCIVINLYNNSSFMNISASLCWGEDEQTIYYIDGVYSKIQNGKYVKTTSYNLYKIQLGMGSNDLSSEGYGTFISGKSDTEYNGTCKVLKTYTGDIRNGSDTTVYLNSLKTPQGMEFDGYIYLGWGTAGHNFVKLEIDEGTNEYRVVDNFMHHEFTANRTEKWYEPELLALYDHKIICGSYSGTNGSLLLVFER